MKRSESDTTLDGWFEGIDGGGTKCAVAVANEAGEIGKGEAGACNV
jgi:N-acetylglucosamine kinase-like BadF-type ATPase